MLTDFQVKLFQKPILVEEQEQDLEGSVKELITYIEKITNEYFDRNKFDKKYMDKIGVEKGTKYWRITKRTESSGSVWGFIDTTNGNILFAKSWKAPQTKNPRGNVYDSATWKRFTSHGPQYLK